jgi:hypothetical protein
MSNRNLAQIPIFNSFLKNLRYITKVANDLSDSKVYKVVVDVVGIPEILPNLPFVALKERD